jgi:hypothetical protein
MNRAHIIPSILFVSAVLLLAGCTTREAASNSPATPTPAASNTTNNANQSAETANANRNANPGKGADVSAAVKPAGPAQLLGTYESREVRDQGVVTLMSQLKTLWMFSADGTYSRVSQVKGKPYHADSGTFRVEPPDKLVLTIQVTGPKAKRRIQNPPLSKTHTFSLSPDGEELKFTSAKGSVGIFQRVAKPKTP